MNAKEYPEVSISRDEAQRIEKLYDDLLGMVKKLSGKTDKETVKESIVNLTGFIIERLSSKEDEPLLLYTSKIFDKDYIFAHSLNVSLISVKIGLRLGFDKNRLKDLGFLALTHAGKDIKLPKGLLNGIKRDKESDEIIRLTDVYDALSHPPAYRHAITPCETLETIINTDKFFDPRFTKILLEELSFYPQGSWVQLSTNEIGTVIKADKERILRPIVKIFIGSEGEYLENAKTVDLSENKLIYILRPLTEEEVKHIKKS